jgi:putative transposase
MTHGLVRYHHTGGFHFLTWSCYHRSPLLQSASAWGLFQTTLEKMRTRYGFVVSGYVLMPEHVHLLVNEPKLAPLAKAIQAIKLSVAVQAQQRPFWQARYYDFNVYAPEKREEKLHYMHWNPVRRGLVAKPEDWPYSSFRHYAFGEIGRVEIESEWTAARRDRAASAHVSESRHGAPKAVDT